MWVRMIHALRLGEYSRKQGFEALRLLLDVFYKQSYTPLQGEVDAAYISGKAEQGLAALSKRPGLFARSLYAAMLHFGPEKVLPSFLRVTDKLPSRLLLSLANGAETYFDPDGLGGERVVRTLTGTMKTIPLNKFLARYSLPERRKMVDSIEKIYLEAMSARYRAEVANGVGEDATVFIDPELYHIPLAVGDRTSTVQDTSCALQGTHFAVEGDKVRLFLQWGRGLPAQPLDMDLSVRIMLKSGEVVECAYYNLAPRRNKNDKTSGFIGAKHSGDIRAIPDQVGTAEYVELNLPQLVNSGAQYVVFTCNAYTRGTLSPNLMVGWMSSAHPMRLSEQDGVAYDPSTVQHIVRISESNLSKGLVFGVLKVSEREIVWMEVPFNGQTLMHLDGKVVDAMLSRLQHKASIGELLEIRAKAQQKSLVSSPEKATERFTYEWALNPAEVSKVLCAD